MILVKEFVSITMAAVETGKRHFSVIAAVAKRKKCFIKNMDLMDTNYHWKKWVEWISTKQEKLSQPQKCIFWEKEPDSLKT